MSDSIDLEKLNSFIPPFGKLLGIKIVEANKDLVIGELPITDDLLTLPGRMHGGAIMGFADNLGAIATVINLGPGQWTTTIESKTNFLRAAAKGTILRGEARPIHKGRKTHVWRTDMFNDAGKLAATVTQTQMILEKN